MASIWRVIVAVLVTGVVLWTLFQMASLVAMIVVAFFFSLALEPAVWWLRHRYGWSRGCLGWRDVSADELSSAFRPVIAHSGGRVMPCRVWRSVRMRVSVVPRSPLAKSEMA